jgi:ribosomal protein S21
MVEIKVKSGETISNALRRLKKAVEIEGNLKTVREKRFFEKPSRKRYRKLRKAKFDQKIRSKYENY